MKIVLQPKGSRVCGQACVAMLLGIDLNDAIIRTGKRGATNLKHLIPLLSESFAFDGSKLSNISSMHSLYRQLPDIGLIRVRWNKKESHWVVKNHDLILDPSFGVQDKYDFYERITKIGGRITSTFSLNPIYKIVLTTED